VAFATEEVKANEESGGQRTLDDPTGLQITRFDR